MNWGHLRATLWLRWRILVNRMRRAGKLSKAIVAILLVVVAVVVTFSLVGSYVLATEVLEEAKSTSVMALWLVPTALFLFFWMIGLLTDLQRGDAMSFRKLLHLPVSFRWVFLYNYLSSFVSVSITIVLPWMLGTWLAFVVSGVRGAWLVLPLVVGTFALVTALTYQFRGWLAALMQDKRRGRNVLAAITVLFVLLLQLPNLINLQLHRSHRRHERAAERELAADGGNGQVDEERARELELAERQAEEERVDRIVVTATEVVPFGWLAYGARAGFEGRFLPSILGALGLFALSGLSLRRSYTKTLASIVGSESARGSPERHVEAEPARARARRPLVERRLPLVGEEVSGVAAAAFQSLLRAPETKMLLLSPVILLGLFGVMLFNNPRRDMLAAFAPLIALGATAAGLLSIVQLIQNQFGLDREGFRAYVLCPARRAHVVMGKNLATAPLALGIGAIALIGLQFLVPSDLAHFLGAWLQLVSAYLLLCMVGNVISILNPMRLKENSFKAASGQWRNILWQLLSFVLVPVTLAPLVGPALLEILLPEGTLEGVPLFPILHALVLGAVLLLYRWIAGRQGELLQEREQRILEILTRD